MHYLFGSEIEHFSLSFRDYVRLTFNEELQIRAVINDQGQEVFGVFIAENSPNFSAILQEKEAFLKNPFAAKYEQAGWQTGDIRTQGDHNFPQINLSAFGQNGKFTIFLTALCILIYILQLIGFEEQIMILLHYPDPDFPEQSTEIWRYFTHSLVHLSLWHIVFNLSWWWSFGGLIEQRVGSCKLLLLYFLSALISGVCQNYASGPAFFGLSGVVYAVLGYVLIIDKLSRHNFNLPKGFFNMLLIGIAFGFISPFFGISIGNAAHISGLITGGVIGLFQLRTDYHIRIK
ncbi:rhomboid family intramembrane serine protease [Rodentibacter caecimuris]|uniref:Rhomboid family intramembrane serine protease GlpG n=1 Tax=Rodentibacter caecimuris TaxID=1796644 RepID=A0ABX3KVY2_9PAST|nr:hypothetical protein BKG89_09085 [Rodentibacter heylii]